MNDLGLEIRPVELTFEHKVPPQATVHLVRRHPGLFRGHTLRMGPDVTWAFAIETIRVGIYMESERTPCHAREIDGVRLDLMTANGHDILISVRNTTDGAVTFKATLEGQGTIDERTPEGPA